MSGAPEDEVSAMVADIEEMDRIIGQFLDFGRGTPQEPPQAIDIASLVRDVTEPYRLRGVDITVAVPDSLVAPARALSIRRALANLIDNALRYAGEDKPLTVTAGVMESEVCIEVADRGPGIPENEVERMRHPFTRLEKARSNTKGAGLGLAIVDRVMRAHQGHLDLLPREGGGLRAILRLPAGGSVASHARMPEDGREANDK
jgi:two-component system osmolarity sensor histidine kinase EnvZ